MKNIANILGLMVLGLVSGCLEGPSRAPATSSTVLYRHHFQGTAYLARTTNTAHLPAIIALPASHELVDVTLQKLSGQVQGLWAKFLPSASPQGALVRPLLDDLLSAESYAETRGPLNRGESVFAIELNDERANLWRTNLASILGAWKLGKTKPLTVGEAKGWEIKRTESPNLIQFVRSGKWVLLGLGPDRLTLFPSLLDKINKNGRPIELKKDVLFELDADCPRLGDWLPSLAQHKLPPFSLTMTGKGEYIRTEAKLRYSQPLPWNSEPWKIPTHLISDPIISFTVGRGIAPLLSQVKGVQELGLKPLPNQFCSWSPGTIHVGSFATVPINNPTNLLVQLGPKLPDFTKEIFARAIGEFTFISNRDELIWQGWPVLVPSLTVIRDKGTDFLLAGLFPVRFSTNRAPAELFSQLENRPNLAYYDWEITQDRLIHAKQLQQLWDIMNLQRSPATNTPTQKWLMAIGPQLGNTVTEAILTAPAELTVVRRSDVGLTGFELATLTRWLASPGFPWRFDPPPLISSRTNNASRTNALAPKNPAAPAKKQ